MKKQYTRGSRPCLRWCTAILAMVALGCGSPQLEEDIISDAMFTAKPQELAAVTVPEMVAAGSYHSLMLGKTGQVQAWGQNQYGQLGLGISGLIVPIPTPVSGLPAAKAIAAGIGHSLALDLNGQVWVWGQNASGQVGMGSVGGTVLIPTKVEGLSGIRNIAAGGNYSLALDGAGQVWAWGQNTAGQVGTGAASASVPSPVKVAGIPAIRAIAAGVNHVLALDTGGGVWAWGLNTSGQVGTGATSSAVFVPTRVTSLPRAVAIAAGAGHSLVIDEQFGNVWAWGQNSVGQLGSGGTSTTPTLVPIPVSGVTAAASIVAGHYFSMARMGNGSVMAWGQNIYGQLGNGKTENSAVPVEVAGLGDAKAIAAGAQHSLAVRPGCPVWAWGNNGQGQLGDGTGLSSGTMVQSQLFNTFYFDGDGDGFGDQYIAEQACTPSPGFVEEVDCDDYSPTTHPGAAEVCNGVDDNCNGTVDDGNPGGNLVCSTGLKGECAAGTTACSNGRVLCVQNNVASTERCDGLDNDCDGERDEDNPGGMQTCSTGKLGVCAAGVTYCTSSALHCVQTVAASSEVCDGLDNDCDGVVDEDLLLQTWYRDADSDGYGNPSSWIQNCRQLAGYVANALDCNDGNAAIRPGAAEVCDGLDNDCDAQVDEGVKTTFYRDADADTYGATGTTTLACSKPTGYATRGGDCNDSNSSIKPGATEVCDGKDNDCDGNVDEGVKTTFYRDADADTYGATGTTTLACSKPTGYATRGGDCNDSSSAYHPGAFEPCGGRDYNCDGRTVSCPIDDGPDY
ncbi:MAG TPA: MopE-related protein [Archangium sp.]|uniref:RCC1 domain-containing protein n=1 Tax=Archangium sp. TaxID=1872627 RepID=UPI002E34DF34|nr:MopE-related protein [Archangium sp.]HEX5749299.1 MopE-related protein [Archangium sp.]